MAKYSGNNRRGRLTIPQHTHPLVRRLFEEINAQQTTLAEVAQRSDVGVDTLRYWRSRHMPRLDLFSAALNTIGFELHIRPKGAA